MAHRRQDGKAERDETGDRERRWSKLVPSQQRARSGRQELGAAYLIRFEFLLVHPCYELEIRVVKGDRRFSSPGSCLDRPPQRPLLSSPHSRPSMSGFHRRCCSDLSKKRACDPLRQKPIHRTTFVTSFARQLAYINGNNSFSVVIRVLHKCYSRACRLPDGRKGEGRAISRCGSVTPLRSHAARACRCRCRAGAGASSAPSSSSAAAVGRRTSGRACVGASGRETPACDFHRGRAIVSALNVPRQTFSPSILIDTVGTSTSRTRRTDLDLFGLEGGEFGQHVFLVLGRDSAREQSADFLRSGRRRAGQLSRTTEPVDSNCPLESPEGGRVPLDMRYLPACRP